MSSIIAPYLTMRHGGVPEYMTEAQVRAWTVPVMREWLLTFVLAECLQGKPCRLPRGPASQFATLLILDGEPVSSVVALCLEPPKGWIRPPEDLAA